MNSSYGRLIVVKALTSYVVKSLDDAHPYMAERFGMYKEMTKFGKHFEISLATFDKSHSNNHFGCLILSMSKRALHEVLDLCNTLNITVTYVDTDAIHVEKDKLPLLSRAYFEAYHQQLIGNALGQFHSDFSIGCGHNESVFSCLSLVLRPKVYFDNLLCTVCNKDSMQYCVKDIPASCMEQVCKDADRIIHWVYKKLCRAPVTFSLNPPVVYDSHTCDWS